ncbi:ABC transporter ATP-binding protein [Amphibacillus sp. Q70]|uniref:ABC transporter ATP-binding protein n=1 Tax=Amphibacillus sp. Q70 TaxID=3453416 RepID=UPI003F833988
MVYLYCIIHFNYIFRIIRRLEVVQIAILQLDQVSKRYKTQTVIDNVSLTIDQPGIYALVGPNGVGKTTLLNCICHIIPINSGAITLLDQSNKSYHVFKQVAYLQDHTVLFHYLTGYDHLKYISDSHQLPKKRVDEVADYVGMSNYLNKKVGDYSLGMKQHLLVAIALVNQPKLLFMDEPLTGLDPSSAIRIRNILLDLDRNGTTVILSSHNLAEIDRVTNQIIFLKDGKLIEVNRADHNEISYHFKLSNLEQGKQLLTKAGYVVEQHDAILKVQGDEQMLDGCIQTIQSQGLSILDLQKEVSGSEKLYETYFGQRS